MGYAGNNDPQWIIPTAIASKEQGKATQKKGNEETQKKLVGFFSKIFD